ncbi:MAG: DUF4912 domain-containing protein [Aridibacter sp.]
MSEEDKKSKVSENDLLEEPKGLELEWNDFEMDLSSSDEFIEPEKEFDESILPESVAEILSDDEIAERMKDPIFRELAEPKLPELAKDNRAKLLMQSPNRIYFYWSMKNNPYRVLNRAFGNMGSYRLIAKLVDQTKGTEELFPVEAEGSYWFDVESDSNYRAEIGFYAPNRPFIRIIFSNTINTPRKNPSPRRALASDWSVSANEFAQVLDVSGFRQDAFDVAIAGDDWQVSTNATNKAFGEFIGDAEKGFDFGADEIRFALLAIASGYSLEDLRGQISERLFAALNENKEKVRPENALASLKEHFDIFADEIWEEEEIGSAVFGASLVNFPKRIKKRTVPKTLLPKLSEFPKQPKISPLSSAVSPISSGNFK